MPYISQQNRQRLAQGETCTTPGELNYQITRLVDDYLHRQGALSYSNINTVIGTLECVKLELYRRLAAPYEDRKQQEHGDVYTMTPLVDA